MKVAIVYDRVNKIGGAERVLVALKKIYPDAPLYTLVYNQATAPWSKIFKVVPTFLNKMPFLRTRHEWLAPFASLAFETFDFSQFDLVITVTSSDAKSVITRPGSLHICYCLTPTRYLWSLPFPRLLKFFLPYFQKVDLFTASRPDHYLSISKEVQKRIQKYYHRKSEVVYPPINYKYFSTLDRDPSDYFLVVSRLVAYKKIDLVINTFKKLNLPLIIVGDGSQKNELVQLAKGSKIKFLGLVSDEELRKLYSQTRAVIFPQIEDFGLVPLEANAAGAPVIALGRGGALETVKDGVTGVLFPDQNIPSLISAIKQFIQIENKLAQKTIRDHAKKFSQEKFESAFSAKVNMICRLQKSRLS